jgi:hypothetical protein
MENDGRMIRIPLFRWDSSHHEGQFSTFALRVLSGTVNKTYLRGIELPKSRVIPSRAKYFSQ